MSAIIEKLLEISINQYRQIHGHDPTDEEIKAAREWLETNLPKLKHPEPKPGILYPSGRPTETDLINATQN